MPVSMDLNKEPVTDDGSVMKKVLKKGSGWDKPKHHDEAFVNLTGKHGDTVFDSNAEEAGPRSIIIGSGYCMGLEEALKSMMKGEKALVDVAARAAWGEKGWSAKGVPPDVDVCFEVQLLKWHSYDQATLARTQGAVRVNVTESGRDSLLPKPDDLVVLKYRAKTRGGSTYFLSKGWEEGAEPAKSVVKDLEPKGLMEAVQGMPVGSKASAVVTSDFAYGKEGSRELNVQPGAKVEFEIEMLHVWKLVDAYGDGGVRLELHEKTTGAWVRPLPGDKVKLSFTARVYKPDEKQTGEEKVVLEKKEVEIEVGADNGEDFTEGVEVAIEHLVDGQSATSIVQPQYHYGLEGKEGIVGAGEALQYHVTLLSTEHMQRGQGLDVVQCKEVADSLRLKGNAAFTAGRTHKALRIYNAALDPVRFLSTLMQHDERELKPHDKEVAEAARLSIFLNLAACHDRLQNWTASVENCRKALEVSPSNRKARFRRARAYMHIGRLIDADADLQALLPGDPEDKQVLALMAEVKRKQKIEDKQQQGAFKKMFS